MNQLITIIRDSGEPVQGATGAEARRKVREDGSGNNNREDDVTGSCHASGLCKMLEGTHLVVVFGVIMLKDHQDLGLKAKK